MGKEHNTRRTSRFPSFVVVVSFDIEILKSFVLNLIFIIMCRVVVCFGTCTAQLLNDETRATTPAKPRPSTTM